MARDRAARPEARPLRLFVAVDVPDRVKESVAAAVRPWGEQYPRARWAPTENWHVTLKFLGATWPRLLDWVVESVATAASRGAPVKTALTGLGAFPSARRARVLWAGLDDGDGHLAALAAALDDVLAREFKAESRAFRAHLTVARSEPPIALPKDFAGTELSSERFLVDRLVLYRSHLRRPAPLYEPLRSFPLGGSGLN